MVSKLRRLIADHADLHNNDLPPNYLFSTTDNQSGDDLSQLTVMLAGPHGTPYSAGLWRLQLRIPDDYPASPPKAAFKTRIWHPNVEESSGAVCVDTLKRDWESKLTLRDILVTISCLLIHPNPDSALNPMAGSLLQDDYNEFARQARLMTSIHAPVPFALKQTVLQAKQRGEDPEMASRIEDEVNLPDCRQEIKKTSLVMKKTAAATREVYAQASNADEDKDGDDDDDCKENDPSLSPEPVAAFPLSSRRVGLGKRPLSVIPTTPVLDSDIVMFDSGSDDENMQSDGMTASERNIAANSFNLSNSSNNSIVSSPLSSQNSFVFAEQHALPQSSSQSFPGLNATNNNESSTSYAIYEDNGEGEPVDPLPNNHHRRATYGKENMATAFSITKSKSALSGFPSTSEISPFITTGVFMKAHNPSSLISSSSLSSNRLVAAKPLSPTKVTKSIHHNANNGINGIRRGTAVNKGKPRTGLRRL